MLDYYYQLLNVPKGTTGKNLSKGFAITKAAYLSEGRSKKDIELLDKAYEILSNVSVTKEKVIDKAGKVQYEYKFHPNPAFYRTFYDRVNSIKIVMPIILQAPPTRLGHSSYSHRLQNSNTDPNQNQT